MFYKEYNPATDKVLNRVRIEPYERVDTLSVPMQGKDVTITSYEGGFEVTEWEKPDGTIVKASDLPSKSNWIFFIGAISVIAGWLTYQKLSHERFKKGLVKLEEMLRKPPE